MNCNCSHPANACSGLPDSPPLDIVRSGIPVEPPLNCEFELAIDRTAGIARFWNKYGTPPGWKCISFCGDSGTTPSPPPPSPSPPPAPTPPSPPPAPTPPPPAPSPGCPNPAAGQLTPASVVQNAVFTGSIPVTNATSATVAGLPAGLTAGAIAGNAIPVSGIPTASGTFQITATLTNVCGSGTTTTIPNVAMGSLQVIAGSGGTVWDTQNCCGSSLQALPYTTGQSVGFTGGEAFMASASGTEVTQWVKSEFGFSQLSGSCGRRSILFLNATGEITGYSIYETAGNILECP